MRRASRAARPGLALALLAGLAVFVSDQHFVRGEITVLKAVNGWPRLIGAPLEASMVLGTLIAGLSLTVLVAVITGRPRLTLALFVASVVAWRLDDLVKGVVERPRPDGLVDGLQVREHATGFGFPSGHTTMAFALAAVLHHVLQGRWRWLPWGLAATVGVARMYVGVHWPVDVIGGAALGTAIGGAAGLLVADGYRRRRS